jgi:shikimate dehydrogenase
VSDRTRLAVLGSPIAHSKSPVLHAAAYAELGLDWEYGARELTGPELAPFVAGLDRHWRGLSLTMPLKREMLPLLDRHDAVAELAGGVNTVRVGDDGLSGYNTDVFGIVRALEDAGVHRVGHAHLLGAGATAASVLLALRDLGARSVYVGARVPERAAPLVLLARRLGLRLASGPMTTGFPEGRMLADTVPEPIPDDDHDHGADHETRRPDRSDLVVSTLPGPAGLPVAFPAAVRRTTTLFDVAYDPWPSALATHWREADAADRVVSGIEMLVNQALAQVRVFVTGGPSTALPDESRVLAAMRASVGLPPATPPR